MCASGLTVMLAALTVALSAPAAQNITSDSSVAPNITSDSISRADSARRARALDTVVVTALRLPTDIRNAPYAAAVNGAEVTRRARPGLALDETLRGVPGVQVDNRFNFALGERITVRGFGARTQFGVRGVRFVVDGIPATLPDGQTTLNHVDLGTVSSAEVIRTPLAALYGNASGGVIALETGRPPDIPLAAATRIVGGSYGLFRRQAQIGGTGRLGGYAITQGRLTFDGFRAHNSAKNSYLTARGSAPVARGRVSTALHHVTYSALNPGALPDSLLEHDRRTAFPANVAQRTGEEGQHTEAGLTLAHPFGGYDVAGSIYALHRSLDNPIPPRIIDLDRSSGGVRVTISSDRTAGRLSWNAGVEGAIQDDDRRNFQNISGARGQLTLDQRERVRNGALFATMLARPSARWTILAGARRDAVSFEAGDRLVSAGNPDDSGERRMSAWTPSAGMSLEIFPGVRAFANAGTSFETPTTTELGNRATGAGGLNPDLDPQHTLSHEIGLNARAGAITTQIALYRARVAGALAPFEVPDVPGRQFFRNATATMHRGAEALISASLATTHARIAYSFTDARYRDYVINGTSFSGHRLPGVAAQQIEILARSTAGRSSIDVEFRYRSRVPVNDANTAWSPPYALLDLRAGIEGARWRRFSFSPFAGVGNVLDRRYNASVVVNAAGARYFEPGPGRTWFAGIDAAVEVRGPRSEIRSRRSEVGFPDL